MFGSSPIGIVADVFALIIGWIIITQSLELIRRWFFNPEYRCEKCGSAITSLVKDHWDLSTGTLYKVRCLNLFCRHWNENLVFYYYGKGRSCGEGYNGWKKSFYSKKHETK